MTVSQEYPNLRNRQEELFCLLKGYYRLTRIRQELNNYFTKEEELKMLLEKVDKGFKKTEFSKDVKRRTDKNLYQLEQHRDILKLTQHRTATETKSSKKN